MLNRSVIVGLLAASSVGSVWAQASACPCGGGSRLNQTQLAAALASRTACAVIGNDRWQELHSGAANASTGPLLELGNKAGGETVGTWIINGTGVPDTTVTYSYTGGNSYTYAVCEEGTGNDPTTKSYHFCGVKNITNARLVNGQGTCPQNGFTRP
jgi:hypothetical protein